MSTTEICTTEEDWDHPQRRQQLINFGHSQWGFNNWSWSVSKQDLDFVDCVGNKCTAGVAAFVSVTVKSFDIHRENVGYATALGPNKGSAIHRARKCAVTNALRETLLSFGGTVATELMELLDTNKVEVSPPPMSEPLVENNPNIANQQEPKNIPLNKNIRKDSLDSVASAIRPAAPPAIKNAVVTSAPPIAKAHPIPSNLPPAANVLRAPRPAPPQAHASAHPPHPQHPQHPHMRPNSNEASGAEAEEARAERKRRQRLAQEEFRLKQMLKPKTGADEALSTDNSSMDNLLMGIVSQDIVVDASAEEGKRKSPSHDQPDAPNKRRNSFINKLDVF